MPSRFTTFACFSIFMFSITARAAEPLPYYDVRLDADGRPAAFVTESLRLHRTARESNARAADFEALNKAIADLRMDDHEFFATPHFLRSTAQFLTKPDANAVADPIALVRRFVADHRPLFEIDAGEITRARVERNLRTKHNGATHLTLQQQIRGIDLYGCEVLATVSCDGELVNIGSTMLPRPAGDFVTPVVRISAVDAIRIAAANVGIVMHADPLPESAELGVGRKQTWLNPPEFRPDEPITSELLYFPLTRGDVRPAWSVLIPEIGIGNTYEMMIDATNGQVLRRWNRLHFSTTEPITFRVYTSDSPAPGSPGTSTPSGVQSPFVLQSLVTVNPGDISAINPNGWIDDGTNETQGNNVNAYLDRDGTPNSPDLPRVSGTPYRVFDFTHDPSLTPLDSTNQSAAVVQLFYLSNFYHDRLWAMGFDEPAKNFQTDNFGRGGTGGDAVRAESQDGSGTNNANFGTSGSDGSTGRCQMYIFTGPTPDRDGDLDADIVFHELSHGLSIRLSNGTVGGSQSGGMGEGWGDYFGASLNAQASDDPNAVFAMGAYSTFQLWGSGYDTNYYFGIRRFPYSTDVDKNPLTYADIDPNQFSVPTGVPRNTNITTSANSVHNVGELWCNTLLQTRANMWESAGFASNQTLMQMVVDGLKLQPTNPNFLQARDGILQADMLNNASANHGSIWKAFAKRGMGPLATSPSGSTAVGVSESFNLLSFTYPAGKPAQLQPGVATAFAVQVASLVAAISPVSASGQLHYSVNGGSFSTVAMTETAPNEYTAMLPAFSCFDVIRFYVSSDTSIGRLSDPGNAPTGAFTALVFQSNTDVLNDDAETDQGWTLGATGDTATTGVWTRGDPVGSAAQPADAHSPINCFFTGQGVSGGGVGDNDVDNGTTTLISPINDLSGATIARVRYWRWFSNNQGSNPNSDTFRVDATGDNGGSWTNIETIGSTFGGQTTGGWFFVEKDVPAGLLTNQFRVRFVADDATANGGSVYEAAVDDVQIVKLVCSNSVTCVRGDVNGDTLVDGQDVGRFMQILLNGGGTPVEHCAGDLAALPNSVIDAGDVPNFVACILAGGGC